MLHKIVCLALPGTAPFEFGVDLRGVRHRPQRQRRARPSTSTSRPPIPGPSRCRSASRMNIDQDLSIAADADLIAVPAHHRGRRRRAVPGCHPGRRGTRRLGAQRLQRRVRARRRPASSTAAARPPTGCTPTSSPSATPAPRSTPTCCSCRTARSSPAPAPRPASTRPCTSCATSSAPRPPTSSPAAWSCRRSATAGSRSTSRPRCPSARATRSPLVTEWMLENLEQDLTVDVLARRALMSSRTFARQFRAETGTTPAAWLNRQRILRAQQLLEETDEGLEQIAAARRLRHRRGDAAPLPQGAADHADELPPHVRERGRGLARDPPRDADPRRTPPSRGSRPHLSVPRTAAQVGWRVRPRSAARRPHPQSSMPTSHGARRTRGCAPGGRRTPDRTRRCNPPGRGRTWISTCPPERRGHVVEVGHPAGLDLEQFGHVDRLPPGLRNLGREGQDARRDPARPVASRAARQRHPAIGGW